MIKCRNCGSLQLEDNTYPIIKQCLELEKPVFCVLVCSCCGMRHVIGGEPDIDFDTGKECIMSIERFYNKEEHSNLQRVIGIIYYLSVGYTKGEFAIVGNHCNLGSGILGWYKEKHHAKVALKNFFLSDPNFKGCIKTKKQALNSSTTEDEYCRLADLEDFPKR